MGFKNVYWSAFTLTALACFNLWAGLAGYNVSRADRFLLGTSWSGHVIWSEVWIGLGCAAGAAFFWRKAIRDASKPQGTRWRRSSIG